MQTTETEVTQSTNEELKQLGEQFQELGETISIMINKFESDKEVLKENIIQWAILMRDILIKTGKKDQQSNIFSLLVDYLVSKHVEHRLAERFIMEALEKFPEFNKPQGQTESNAYYRHVMENLSKISKLDYSKLSPDQSKVIGKKMDMLNRAKANELKTEHEIDIKKEDGIVPTQLDETETKKIKTKKAVNEPQPTEITYRFQEIRDLMNILVNRSMYYPPPNEQIRDKICNSLDHFIKQLKYITDEKSKITYTDWADTAQIADAYRVNAGHSLIEFDAPLCPKCKDIDTDLDAWGRKKIYKHVDMRREYSDRFDPTKPYEEQDAYVFRCPRCKGTEMMKIKLTHERIASNYLFILKMMVDNINTPNILNALEIYSKSCEQPFKMATSKEVSNKLLSK